MSQVSLDDQLATIFTGLTETIGKAFTYHKGVLYHTLPEILATGARGVPIDSVICDMENLATTLGNMPASMEHDLFYLYVRTIPTCPSVNLKELIAQLSVTTSLHYNNVTVKEAEGKVNDVYSKHPYLLIVKLLELLPMSYLMVLNAPVPLVANLEPA